MPPRQTPAPRECTGIVIYSLIHWESVRRAGRVAEGGRVCVDPGPYVGRDPDVVIPIGALGDADEVLPSSGTFHKKTYGWPHADRMEAAGIEPASRNISDKASTCVVDLFISTAGPPIDRLPDRPARSEFVADPHRADQAGRSLLLSLFRTSRHHAENGLLFRQPCSTVGWHLSFLPRFLTRLHDVLDTPPCPQPVRSSPFRPQEHQQLS